MKPSKQKRLEADGWRVGKAADFLGLSAAESLLVDIRLALADAVRARRTKLGLTQSELAARIQSSQSRVAKLEAGDSSVSLDLLVFALGGLGVTRQQLGKVVGPNAA